MSPSYSDFFDRTYDESSEIKTLEEIRFYNILGDPEIANFNSLRDTKSINNNLNQYFNIVDVSTNLQDKIAIQTELDTLTPTLCYSIEANMG